MRLRSPHLAVLSVALVFSGIFISMLMGVWQTESSKIPAAYTEGAFAGEYNPADIRGSYTFEDIEKAFDVPIEAMAKAYGFADHDNPAALQAKIFEDIFGEIDGKEIGTDSVRLFVALYISRPYTAEETTALPMQAIDLLVGEGRIDVATAAEIREKHGVEIDAATADRIAASPGIAGQETTAGESGGESHDEQDSDTEESPAIKGKTTFGELMDWGLSREEIEEVIGRPMGPANQAMRDFFIEQGIEFSPYKDELQKRLAEK